MMPSLRLGDLLVERGTLTPDQRDAVIEYQRHSGRPFGELAERLFNVSAAAVEDAWADQYAAAATLIDPRAEPLDPDVLPLIERRQAWQFRVLPLRRQGGELMVCATRNHLVRALRFVGWRIQEPTFLVLSRPEPLGQALERYYPMPGMTPAMV
ncbi:MAG: hypothetical protein ACKVW3_03200 [Phycisphaerales bacterium]